jgi:hypothetical protein
MSVPGTTLSGHGVRLRRFESTTADKMRVSYKKCYLVCNRLLYHWCNFIPFTLCKLGMCVIVANTMEQCSLFLPLQRGAGPMALMLWLD